MPEQVKPATPEIKLSIVNARHPDPAGSAYSPPTPERPWWVDPDGERVTVGQVWAGADEATRRWIYDKTMACFVESYDRGFHHAENESRVFRGGNVEHLLAEIRSQLGPNHWATQKRS